MARILVIDDEIAIGEFVRDVAEGAGHEVKVCVDSAEAMALAGATEFDIVVTDMVMPKFDGMEFARWLGRLAHKPELIFMSGFDSVYSKVAILIAEQGGIKVRGHLQKPFRVRDLTSLIE